MKLMTEEKQIKLFLQSRHSLLSEGILKFADTKKPKYWHKCHLVPKKISNAFLVLKPHDKHFAEDHRKTSQRDIWKDFGESLDLLIDYIKHLEE